MDLLERPRKISQMCRSDANRVTETQQTSASRVEFDRMVSDVQMPEVGGTELLGLMRERHAQAPVVLIMPAAWLTASAVLGVFTVLAVGACARTN